MTHSFKWTGRTDPEDGSAAKRWHHVVENYPAANSKHKPLAGLLGFGCDLGVKRNKGRVGAAAAPDILRKSLANFAWHGKDGYLADFGTLSVDNSPSDVDILVAAQHQLGDKVCEALQVTDHVLVLGGGHETAAGSFDGLLKWLGSETNTRIGILNLDAHFDLRMPGDAGVSSGTPFYQIHETLKSRGQDLNYLCLGIAEISNTKALFDRALSWGVDYMLDRDVRPHCMENITQKINQFLTKCDVLYLTIDLDVLPHWQMPAVSAPAPYGVEITVIEDIIRYLGQKSKSDLIKWPLSDVVEFNPEFDESGRSAKVAARICDQIIGAMI